jgi:PIN domain nuclease of toxin-antitoxin system
VVSKAIVIDASAALAFLLDESQGHLAPPFLANGVMSVVNYAEVVQRLRRGGIDPEPRLQLLLDAGVSFVSPDLEAARLAGDLERQTKPFGISLADRFCLAHAILHELPLLTADRAFSHLGLALDIRQLR